MCFGYPIVIVYRIGEVLYHISYELKVFLCHLGKVTLTNNGKQATKCMTLDRGVLERKKPYPIFTFYFHVVGGY